MLTIRELLDRLADVDESADIETKRAASDLGRSALETISAFSNEPGMGGGCLLFGVAEDQITHRPTIVGVADAKKLEQEISTICATGFNRAIRPTVWIERVDDVLLVAAFIPEASPHEKPVFIRKSGMVHGSYRRIGTTDQRCTYEDLRVLYRAGDTTGYEDTLVPDASEDELDPSVITAYRRQLLDANPATELRDASPTALVHAVGGVRRDGGRLVPTVAGVLLFGTRLLLRRVFPQLRVDYIRVPGTQWVPDTERRYDSVEIRDPLLTAFRRCYQAIVDDLPRAFILEPGSPERKDRAAVPDTVIREALVNALTHRDYRVPSAIQVIRYADRLEIRNPGHSLVSRDQLGQPGSFPRNPRIADVFREMGLAENKGTGIEAMRRAMKRADLVPPLFDTDTRKDQFVTILWFHSLLDDVERVWLDTLEIALDVEQRQALVVAKRTGFVHNAGLRDLTGLDPLQARRALHRLRELGLLEMRGERGGAFYVLAGVARASSTADPREPSYPGQPGSDRPEPAADRPELAPDRPEPTADRPEPGDSGDPGTLHLPPDLRQAVSQLGARPRMATLRTVLLRLCAWRQLRSSELGEILGMRPDNLARRHLAPMADAGYLSRAFPSSPKHPDQAYRSVQGALLTETELDHEPEDFDDE
ncbi:MAG: putative DNA binding domain-containing protein [Proteobacteria bacterium]|nr:putative DNA binding domain-containing protein [Pseudomonadota bacterium]